VSVGCNVRPSNPPGYGGLTPLAVAGRAGRGGARVRTGGGIGPGATRRVTAPARTLITQAAMSPRTVKVLLAAALAAAPAARAAAADKAAPTLAYELYRLDNGLTVILHEDHTAPLVGVHVEYDVGSKDEKPKRNGFAHLFEHLMFQGTEHMPKGLADRLLNAAGGDGNGGTGEDSTVYWEEAPSNALDQLLYVESERMGWLLPTLDQTKMDNQREVVINELRQRYEMEPYGMAMEKLMAALWNPEFPYSWMAIGNKADLEAATLGDVREFFLRWYGPGNATLAIAGDFDPAQARALVAKWFGPIPARPPPPRSYPPPTPLTAEKRVTMRDRVQLPRLYIAWQTPKVYAEGDAALDVLSDVLSGGKSARFTARLEMKERIAQDVSAGQSSQALASFFLIEATPKPGVTLEQLEKEIDEELARIAAEPPSAEEFRRAQAKILAHAVYRLEPVGGFGGQAATLAAYSVRTGDPGFLERDLARYRSLTPADVSAAARTWLRKDARVVLQVVPGEPGSGSPGTSARAGGDQ
jgi:zinc protease